MKSEYFADVGPDNVTEMVRALKCDPAAILSFAADLPPASEPVGPYITDFQERRDIFLNFQRESGCYAATAALFACFMVAPLEQLRRVLSGRSDYGLYVTLTTFNSISAMAMRAYLQKYGPATPDQLRDGVEAIAAALTPKEIDDATWSDGVKARDGHVCVFSGMTDPEAARIFPFTSATSSHLATFRLFLEAFWGRDKTFAWSRVFETTELTQSTMNGISMSRQLRFWFDNAKFALKPLRTTPDGIVVQWHWLKPAVLEPKSTFDPDKDVLQQAGLSDNQTWGDCLAHRKSGVPIRTGQTFLLRADAQGNKPDWSLLELQWNMRRVIAICGAADVGDKYFDSWSDAGDPEEDILATYAYIVQGPEFDYYDQDSDDGQQEASSTEEEEATSMEEESSDYYDQESVITEE